jgi:hypothetical protein
LPWYFKHVCSEHNHSHPGRNVIVDCGLSYPGLGTPSGLNQAFIKTYLSH